MHALRTCDFCDGDAAGTFEVLPPRLEPTEAEQRRVVLCPGCKARLEDLLEPLLARAGEAPPSDSRPERTRRSDPNATGSTPESAETDEGDEPSTDATSDATDDADPNDEVGGQVEAGDDEPDTANAETGAERDAEPDAGPEDDSASDTSSENDPASDTSTEDSPESDPLLEDGITFERSEPVESAAKPVAAEPETVKPEATAEDEPEAGDTERASDDTEPERSSADGSATADDADGSAARQAAKRPPKAYGKVMRLLRNRHFPMQRSAVEELAAGAYDLEAHEAEAVVDHAVERGEFVESRDLLERPDS